MIKLIPKIFGGKTKKKKKAAAKPTPPSTIERLEAASTALEKAAGPQESAVGAKPQANLEAAKPGAAKPGTMTDREKLIQNALAIHREKSKLLDTLPPAVRTKLTAMAMAIYIKQRSDNEKN